MFQSVYQGGSYFEIFEVKNSKAIEKNEDRLFKVINTNGVTKIYDKTIKSYLYEIDSQTKTKFQFPKDERQELGLTQRYLVFQIFVPSESSFSLEVTISDTAQAKRRILFKPYVQDIEKTNFHIKAPLNTLQKDVWINLSFDLVSFMSLFPGCSYRSLEGFTISGAARLRKIFATKDEIAELPSDEESTFVTIDSSTLNKILKFPPGTVYKNQLISLESLQRDFDSLRGASIEKKDPKSIIKNLNDPYNLSTAFKPNPPLHENSKIIPKKRSRRNVSIQIIEESDLKSPTSRKSLRTNIPQNQSSERIYNSRLSPKPLCVDPGNLRRNLNSSSKKQLTLESTKAQLNNTCNPDAKTKIEDKKTLTFQLIQQRTQQKSQEAREKLTKINLSRKKNHKKSLSKQLDISETENKLPVLPQRLGSKSPAKIRLLNDLSPNSTTSMFRGISSVKNGSTKNPWTERDVYLLRQRNQNTQNVFNKFIKTAEPENNSGFRLNRYHISGSANDRNTKFIRSNSKEYSDESDRFSTFYKSRDGHPWLSCKDEECEEIEENLENDNNINHSRVRSRNILDKKSTNCSSIQECDTLREAAGNKTPDIYRLFRKEKHEMDNSIKMGKQAQLEEDRLLEQDKERTKKILNQLEEKVNNITLNSRPFSPPFVSKHRSPQPHRIYKQFIGEL